MVLACVAAGTSALPVGDGTTADGDGHTFTEVARASGIDFTHRSGARGAFLFPEIMGGGAGWLDFDGDGDLDAYLVDSGETTGLAAADDGATDPADRRTGNRLFRNDGRGRFLDVTGRAGVAGRGYGMGVAAGDYDNDGDVDIFVANAGVSLLERHDGGRAVAAVRAGAAGGASAWSTAGAFFDYEADGDLDLFVANYVDWSDKPAFTEKRCFSDAGARAYSERQSDDATSEQVPDGQAGDGTFTDVSAAAGLLERLGTGLGVVSSDLDDDGDVDVYVSNDQMPSFAWINQGDGTFVERATLLGCAVDEMGRAQGGMGVDAGDVDGDGDMDLWKVHLHRESHVLYRNLGDYFEDATTLSGLAAVTRRATGFGTALFDYDLDGLLDAFVANGRVQFVNEPYPVADPYAEPNQLLRQTRDGWFEDVSAAAGPALATVENSRAAAFGDYDNDGDVDVLVANRDGPARLLRNDAARLGRPLTLRLTDRAGRDAYGARVTVAAGGGRRVFEARAAYSYAATNDPRVHVGVPEGTSVESVEVRWPDGSTSRYPALRTDRIYALRQPGGRSSETDRRARAISAGSSPRSRDAAR